MKTRRRPKTNTRIPPARLGLLYHFPAKDDPSALPIAAYCMNYPRMMGGMRDVHYHLEFGVVLKGRLRHYTRHHGVNLGPGGVWYCGMWEPHGLEFLECPNQHLLVTIQPQMLTELSFGRLGRVDWLAPFTAPPTRRPQFPPARRSEGLAIARRMAALSRCGSRQNQLQIHLLFLELMLILQGEKALARPPHAIPPADIYDLVGRAVHRVVSTIGSVSTGVAARALGTSRQTLGRQFQQLMGMSFSEFALNHRLGMAANRLAISQDAVKAIALDWGFKQTSNFDRCFRARFGCSPQEYRRRKL